jgi:NADPH2:quinone reductase
MLALTIPRFGDADVLELREMPVPTPASGEIAVDVAFAGLNYAEVLYRRGVVDVPLPFVPGIEVAGHVREVGEGVTGFAPGQPVAALTIVASGGYAPVAVTDARLAAPLPDGLPLEVAACTPSNSTTAFLVVERVARMRSGETALVHAAAGGVGSQVGQAARLVGAARVVGTVGGAAKVDAAKAFGYDEVVVRDAVEDRVMELTESRGFDVIVDPVGGATRDASIEALALGGRLVAMGNASGADDVVVSTNKLWLEGKGVIGFNLAAFSATFPDAAGAALRTALEAVAAGRMRVDVREVVPLARAPEYHQLLEDGRTIGKVALALDGSA